MHKDNLQSFTFLSVSRLKFPSSASLFGFGLVSVWLPSLQCLSVSARTSLNMQESADWGQSSSSIVLNPVHPALRCELTVRAESPRSPGLHVFLCCSRRITFLRWRRPWWLSAARGCSRTPAKSFSRTVPSKITRGPSVPVYFGPLFRQAPFRRGMGLFVQSEPSCSRLMFEIFGYFNDT